jgi:hypothetical protein
MTTRSARAALSRLCSPRRKTTCLCTCLLVSEQPCEADQIPWMGGKGVGSLGMAGPTHNHGAFDVQVNGISRLLPSAVPIFFWERELTRPGYAVFVMLHGMSCFDLPKKKGSVPTPISIASVRHMAWQGNPLGWEKNHGPSSAPEQSWQDGAGGLLLVAAAHETGLLAQLETAIAPCLTQTSHPQLSPSCRARRSLLLTLLFLNAVGLRRTRDLRGYTGEALGLLTGRQRAYSYWHTERFLTHLAIGGGAEMLTNALGKWFAALWQSGAEQEVACCVYIDGHRKPVYVTKLIPLGQNSGVSCAGALAR